MNRTITAILSTSFVALFNTAIGIIISIALARSLGIENLGEFAIIITFSSIISTFGAIVSGGFEILIGRDRKLFILLFLLLTSFLFIEYLVIIGLLNYSYLNHFLEILYKNNVYYFFIAITILGTFSDGIRRLLNGRQHFQYINLNEFIAVVVYALCIIGIYLKNKINIEFIIYMMFIAACFRATLYLVSSIYLNRNNLNLFTKDSSTVNEVLKIGFRNLFAGAPSYVPKIILLQLSNSFGNSQIGLYKIGLMAYEASLIVPNAAANVLRGKAASADGSWKRSSFLGYLIFIIYILGALLFYMIGDYLLLLIFGPEFVPAKQYVLYFIVIGALASFYYILESEIHGRAAYPIRMVIYGVAFLLIAISGNYFIIQHFISAPLSIFPFLLFIYSIWLAIWFYFHRFYKKIIKD